METSFDAIIVGAGPAGTSAAIMLAMAGWSVALVEKQQFPRRKVCGECIAASVLPLLGQLGVGQALNEVAGAELKHVALVGRAATVSAPLPAFDHPTHAWGRAVDREHLDGLLLARAGEVGVALFQPWIACEVGGNPGNFFCRIRSANPDVDGGPGPGMATDGSRASVRLRAPVLIAAQGSWSSLRGLDSADGLSPLESSRAPRRAGDLFAFKANFTATSLAPGVISVLAFAGGYGGMVLARDGIATVACCLRRDRLAAGRMRMAGANAGDAVEALLKESCAGLREALHGAAREEKWLSVGPIRPGIRVTGKPGGAFRVGNAAAEAHPVIGEGISMALQSSCLLAARLIHAREAEGTLSSTVLEAVRKDYARAWEARFSRRLAVASALAGFAMRPQAELLLPLIKTWPSLLMHAARISGKVRPAVPVPVAGGTPSATPNHAVDAEAWTRPDGPASPDRLGTCTFNPGNLT
ncbi:MAG: FAD-dependent oxidoreductase [Herminiimonas sp.]|nr:FAD-dependent oxidoreductase [Herminiimonas sp.]